MFDLVPFKRRNGLAKLINGFDENLLTNFFDDDFFSGSFSSIRTDIRDEGKNYVIEAEIPGFNKNDISLEINDNILTISASKNEVIDEKDDNFIRKERHIGKVSRSFRLDNINDEKIEANYNDGVLKLVLPKVKEEKQSVKKIEIQ